jgi:hypothetical protein
MELTLFGNSTKSPPKLNNFKLPWKSFILKNTDGAARIQPKTYQFNVSANAKNHQNAFFPCSDVFCLQFVCFENKPLDKNTFCTLWLANKRKML